MSEQTCDNCGRWERMTGLTLGNCPLHCTTAAGYHCERWVIIGSKPADSAPGGKAFDLASAAEKVLTAYAAGNIPRISIVSVHGVLSSPYTPYKQAAEVVEYLKSIGAIGAVK